MSPDLASRIMFTRENLALVGYKHYEELTGKSIQGAYLPILEGVEFEVDAGQDDHHLLQF